VGRWHVRVRRTGIGLLGLVALLLALGALLLEVVERPRVRRLVAGELETRLAMALGRGVEIGDVHLGAFPPRVTVTGVVVGDPAAPLLTVARVEVLLGELSLAERELVIDNILLSGVRIAARAPSLPAATKGGGGPWVRVAVRQIEIRDFQIERLEIPDTLSVKALDVEARFFGSARTPVAGAVAQVGAFELKVPGIEPVSGSLRLWGRKSGLIWKLQRLRGSGPGWKLDANGELARDAAGVRGEVFADTAELDRLLHIHAGLEGMARVAFDAARKGAGGFEVDARVQSGDLKVAGFEVRGVDGEVHISPEGLEASLVEGQFAEGTVSGSYTLGAFKDPWPHRVALRGEALEVASFLHTLGVPDAGLAGRARASLELSWDGQQIKQGYGTAVADLEPAPGPVPTTGRVVLSLNRDGAIEFSAKDADIGGARVRWAGGLTLGDWLPSWSIQAERAPVATIRTLLLGWVGVDVVPAPLTGTVALDIRLVGSFHDLRVVGDMALAPVAFGPVEADGVEASFAVGQGVLHLDHGLVVVGHGQTAVTGDLFYGAGNRLNLEFSGKNVPLARAITWGGVHAPLSGEVKLQGVVAGTLDSPQVVANLGLSRVAFAGLELGDGQGCVEVADGVVSVANLQVGPLGAHARIDLARRRAAVDASLDGLKLESFSPSLERLAGGLLDCQLHGDFPLDEPAGRVDVTSVGGARGVVTLDDKGLGFNVARPNVWRLSGGLRRDGGVFAGVLTFGVDSFRALVRDLANGELPVEGHLRGQARVTIESGKPVSLEGIVEELETDAEGEKGRLTAPARFSIQGGAVRIEPFVVTGPTSRVQASGSRSAEGALAGKVEGDVPAALVGLFWRDAKVTGRAHVNVTLSGNDDALRFAGTAHVDNGSLKLPYLPAVATRASGDVEFIPEAVKVDNLRYDFLGGTATCTGRVAIEPEVELDLTVNASHVRWPLPLGLTPVLSGPIRIVGPPSDISVSGDLSLDRTVYRRPLDIQKLVLENVFAPTRSRASETGAISFNITVGVPSTLEVDTELAHLTAKGELRVVGTSAHPAALGRLEALPGGEAELAGLRYQLDHCVLTFTNPDEIEPVLDIKGRTTVADVEVTVGLLGTLDRMVPTFTSSPPLPEMDIVSLLSTGKRADSASSASVGTMASSFLTDQLTGAVTSRARSLLAVDQLRVDPFSATESGEPTARLTVAKQLARGWSVTLATNLSSNREEVIESRYQVAPGVYLNVKRQEDGTYYAEVTWQRRY
jgi:hypothetical protein